MVKDLIGPSMHRSSSVTFLDHSLWGVVLETQIILQHFCYNSNMVDWVIIYHFCMTPYFFFINQTLSRQRKIVKLFLILDFSLSPLTCMLHHQDLLVALYIKEKIHSSIDKRKNWRQPWNIIKTCGPIYIKEKKNPLTKELLAAALAQKSLSHVRNACVIKYIIIFAIIHHMEICEWWKCGLDGFSHFSPSLRRLSWL